MTPAGYLDALDQLHLNHAEAAKLLGVQDRTSRRWGTGEAPIPRSVAIALQLIFHFGISPAEYENQLRLAEQREDAEMARSAAPSKC